MHIQMGDKVVVPLGFSRVQDGIFRSAYPQVKIFPFLSTLQLKSIVCLNPTDLRKDLKEFAISQSIQCFEFDIGVNQEPFVVMSTDAVRQAVEAAQG